MAPHGELTFVARDLEILGRSFDVEFLSRRELASRRRILPRVLHRLATRRCDLIYIWFADPYDSWQILLLARLFGVPGLLVLGGYETAALPEVGYGGLLEGRRQVALALRLAHTLLPASELLAREARHLARSRRVRVLPPGIDCEFFRSSARGRERLVVTVGTIAEPTWRIKGLDLFAACARLLPDATFVILGPCEDERLAERLRDLAGGNLTLSSRRLSPAELLAWFQRATVYAQLSLRESFGVALAEAMACECVPVVARSGALAEVVGDTGFVVPYGRPDEAAAAIRSGLALGSSPAARRRVLASFDDRRRARELTGIIAGIVAGTADPRSRAAGVPA